VPYRRGRGIGMMESAIFAAFWVGGTEAPPTLLKLRGALDCCEWLARNKGEGRSGDGPKPEAWGTRWF
jgi:hypothetical protein